MRKADQEIPSKPTIPSEEIRKLRATLILEEALETIAALGFEVVSGDGTPGIGIAPYGKPNLEEIADGCADLSVVTIGTLSACGIHDEELLKEVDDSNLRKFDIGSYKREDGKWMKPPNWKTPVIKEVLENQEEI